MSDYAKAILKDMSVEDKARLASGKDFWYLEEYAPAGLQSIMVTDGPHGLRKQSGTGDRGFFLAIMIVFREGIASIVFMLYSMYFEKLSSKITNK